MYEFCTVQVLSALVTRLWYVNFLEIVLKILWFVIFYSCDKLLRTTFKVIKFHESFSKKTKNCVHEII